MDELYKKNMQCKLCEKKFTSLGVRRSKQQVASTDSDFCIHYKGEVPYFYFVLVCPECGYAFLESFKNPPDSMRDRLRPMPDMFSGRRNSMSAELAFKRAVECAKMQKESDAVLASLYLHLAWIYRGRGEEEKEKEMLAEALGYYNDVYEKSDIEDPSRVMYLVGELHRRLGRSKEAVFWFSRVVNDKEANPAMRNRARTAWQLVAENK